ncbi:hypothetical protein GHT06_004669 [Daphnia sinensis]|uniref:Secreted protein n=1 Tax=Daphnia sinensis TaxID=1820382 RepID=A0AAD5PN99_9CRUS|nr:hypothetical protein GHT06_005407 [Daphnia sinensis]KAI9550859.1 hypothetical protein GHT06_004669 [Daphnia sinensis]
MDLQSGLFVSLALFSILLATDVGGTVGSPPSNLRWLNRSTGKLSLLSSALNCFIFGVSPPMVLSESDESTSESSHSMGVSLPNGNKKQINRFPPGRITVLIRTANLLQIYTEFQKRLFNLFTGFKTAEYRTRNLL